MLAGETTGPVPEDRDRLTVISIAGGSASGRLVGGCLVDFIYTIGTPWEPDLDGAIFFFEEVSTAPIQIDRALLYLEQVGKLKGVRGIVVGELAGCEWYEHTSAPRSKTLEEVLEDRLGGLGVPVLYGLPLGHGATLATLPLGVAGDGRCGRAEADDRRARAPASLALLEPEHRPAERRLVDLDPEPRPGRQAARPPVGARRARGDPLGHHLARRGSRSAAARRHRCAQGAPSRR